MLAPRITAMQESRMAAVEQRIDADLQAGLDRELVGELAELVAEHPQREHLRAQQMVALYRCAPGRRAEGVSRPAQGSGCRAWRRSHPEAAGAVRGDAAR
jgi:DNA-binding SARP family transcriptional activator